MITLTNRALAGVCWLVLIALAATPLNAQDGPPPPAFEDPNVVRDEIEDIFSTPEFRRLKYDRSDAEITDSKYKPAELPEWVKRTAEAIGSVLGPTLSYLFWIVVAVICGLIVYVVYVGITSIKGRSKKEAWLPDDFEEGDAALSPAELSADVYLNRAAELAAAGNTREAIAQLLLGAMSYIEREGLIRFRRGLTCRDYLRAARSREELHAALGQIVGIYEPICFGRRDVLPEHYETSLDNYLGAFHAT